MTTAPKLEPCPFDCDNHAGGTVIDGPWGGGRQVMCNSCNARGPICETDGEAIAEWNRRAAPSAGLREEVIEECALVVESLYHPNVGWPPSQENTARRIVAAIRGLSKDRGDSALLTLSKEGGSALTPRVSPKVSLYQAAKQLLDLAVRIERARTDAEENRLCDERDALLAKFRAADARGEANPNHPPQGPVDD